MFLFVQTGHRWASGSRGNATFGYDPVYHGPFLYHWGALVFFLFGDSDFTARLPYALSGIFLLWLVWETRKLVGVPMAIGMLAAVVLAVGQLLHPVRPQRRLHRHGLFRRGGLRRALFEGEARGVSDPFRFFLAIGYAVKENSYIYGFTLGVLRWGGAFFV